MHDIALPPPAATPEGVALRYMTLASLGLEPGRLDFYQLLLSCKGEGALREREEHARRFLQDGYGRARFIARLDALPAPLLRFPLWRTELEALPGELAQAALLDCVQAGLGQPAGAFLDAPGWQSAQADVWQSLLALALTGADQLADAALAAQLTDVLRVGYFLRTLEGGAHRLAGHGARRTVLAAQLAWPDELAPLPH